MGKRVIISNAWYKRKCIVKIVRLSQINEHPNVIGHLWTPIGLDFSHNCLIGSIPPSLGRLNDLEWLDLSSNKLGGEISKEQTNLTFLEFLNLAENKLIGRISQDKQWSTFSIDSFVGNLGLCGPPLSKTCLGDALPPQSSFSVKKEESIRHESWFDWNSCAWAIYISIVGFSLRYIALETRRPEWIERLVVRCRTRWLKKLRSREGIRFGKWSCYLSIRRLMLWRPNS